MNNVYNNIFKLNFIYISYFIYPFFQYKINKDIILKFKNNKDAFMDSVQKYSHDRKLTAYNMKDFTGKYNYIVRYHFYFSSSNKFFNNL